MMYKIVTYIPEPHLEVVKTAVFEAGAGKIGNYDCCCWQVKGMGQFRPLDGANPFKGSHNKLEQSDEYYVEMVCDDSLIQDVIDALKSAHPYEEPAFQYWRVCS